MWYHHLKPCNVGLFLCCWDYGDVKFPSTPKKIPFLENLAAVSISRNDTIRKMKKSNEIEIWWWWCAMLQTTLGIELPDGVPWLTINNVLTDCSAWALSIKELLWNRRVSLIVDFIFLLGQCFSPSINFLVISVSHQISHLTSFWDKRHTGPPQNDTEHLEN